METLTLSFKYTQNEYVKAERKYLLASNTVSKLSIAVLMVFLPFSVFYLFLSSFSFLSITAFAVALIYLIFGCLVYFYMPVYKFKQTSKYHEVYALTFSNNGIHFKTPSIDSELKWSVYSSLWESADFYYLIQTPRMYALVPKRAFKYPDDMEIFEKIAAAGLKCEKRGV